MFRQLMDIADGVTRGIMVSVKIVNGTLGSLLSFSFSNSFLSSQLPFGASHFDVGTGSTPQVDMGSGMA